MIRKSTETTSALADSGSKAALNLSANNNVSQKKDIVNPNSHNPVQNQDRNLVAVHNLTARVIDFNKKKRNDLSVIAQTTSLGNITESFLNYNLSQLKKEINSFKQKIVFNTKTANS